MLESGSKPGPSVVLVVSPRSSLNRLSLFSPPAPAPCSPWRTSPALPVQRLQALAACVLPVPSNWFLHLRYRPETLSLWFCMPSWCTRARVCVCTSWVLLGTLCLVTRGDTGGPAGQEAGQRQPVCLGRSYLNFWSLDFSAC